MLEHEQKLKNQIYIVIPEGIYHHSLIRRGYLMHHLQEIEIYISRFKLFSFIFFNNSISCSLTYLELSFLYSWINPELQKQYEIVVDSTSSRSQQLAYLHQMELSPVLVTWHLWMVWSWVSSLFWVVYQCHYAHISHISEYCLFWKHMAWGLWLYE